MLALPTAVHAAGTAPLAEWQSSAGVLLDQLAMPAQSGLTTTLGLGFARLARSPGAAQQRNWAYPVFDLRSDRGWFVSTEEGLGYQLSPLPSSRAGVALDYDYGRSAQTDGLVAAAGVHASPAVKLFGEYAWQPLLLRLELRRMIAGSRGTVADASAYLALPLGSDDLVLLTGPSLTLADSAYMHAYYDVTTPAGRYRAAAGLESASWGSTLVWSLGEHWIFEGYAAKCWPLGRAATSPLTQAAEPIGGGLAVAYQF